jgi:hypothetical protein
MRGDFCSCGDLRCASPAKHPRTRNGVKDASAHLEDVVRWWAEWPDANVAIRTGAESDVVVLDIDPRHGGDEGLVDLECQYGQLPKTATSLTGGGGLHFLFKHPGRPVANRTNLAGFKGIDLKGDGGYIIAPPSDHASGGSYTWNPKLYPADVGFAPCPEYLLELANQKRDVDPVAYERRRVSSFPDRLGFYLEHDDRVRARFERDNTGLVDSSASGIEFALGSLLAYRGFEGWEIEVAIATSRERVGLSPRPSSFYRSTIGKVLAEVGR